VDVCADARLRFAAGLAIAFGVVSAAAQGQDGAIAPDRVKRGADIYAQNCAPCHGARMADPQGAFDLRTFPRDEKNRFLNSVAKGKNNMPPWGGLLKDEEIEALWAYVLAGEKK
jgi:mono/diheme cytochrome c family protein